MTGRRRAALLLSAAMAAALAPSAHAEDTWLGVTCGILRTNDPSGQVIQDPSEYTGIVMGGPVSVVNTTGGSINDVTLTCTVRINDASYGAGTSRSSTISGGVGLLIDTITYQAQPGDDPYLCTEIHWNGSKGTRDYRFDADPDTAGDQCALLTTIEV